MSTHLTNLCLDVKLPADRNKIILAIDPAAKPDELVAFTWDYANKIQAVSRLNRMPPPKAPHNFSLRDALEVARIKTLDVDRLARDGYDHLHRQYHAERTWDDDFDMSLVVKDPHDFDPNFINDWIFGPGGEFTGYARFEVFAPMVSAMMGVPPGRHQVCPLKDRHAPQGFLFRLTKMDRRDGIFLQFEDYRSYAFWGRFLESLPVRKRHD